MANTNTAPHAQQTYVRFQVAQRIEHILLIASFGTLGFTGLIQRYAGNGVAEALIAILGGIELVRIIHRIAAIILALQSVYHVIVLLLNKVGMMKLRWFCFLYLHASGHT